MSETQNLKVDYKLSLVSRIIAGAVFLSFVVGLAYTLGWYQGFGLLTASQVNEEITSYIGFFASFSLIPKIFSGLLHTLLNWHIWLIVSPILLFFIVFRLKSNYRDEHKKNDNFLKIVF